MMSGEPGERREGSPAGWADMDKSKGAAGTQPGRNAVAEADGSMHANVHQGMAHNTPDSQVNWGSSGVREGRGGLGRRLAAGNSGSGKREGGGVGAGMESEEVEGVWDDLDASETGSGDDSNDEDESGSEEGIGEREEGLGRNNERLIESILVGRNAAPSERNLYMPRIMESAGIACNVSDAPRVHAASMSAAMSAGDWREGDDALRGHGRDSRQRDSGRTVTAVVDMAVARSVRQSSEGDAVSVPVGRWPIRGMVCVDEGVRELKERVMQAAEAVATQEVRGS